MLLRIAKSPNPGLRPSAEHKGMHRAKEEKDEVSTPNRTGILCLTPDRNQEDGGKEGEMKGPPSSKSTFYSVTKPLTTVAQLYREEK